MWRLIVYRKVCRVDLMKQGYRRFELISGSENDIRTQFNVFKNDRQTLAVEIYDDNGNIIESVDHLVELTRNDPHPKLNAGSVVISEDGAEFLASRLELRPVQ